jgi:hypothetical protein
MVGIKVGGIYTGLGVDSIVAVALGTGVVVSGIVVAVVVGETGGEVTCNACPQAVANKHTAMTIFAPKSFFMLIHSLADPTSF